MLQNIQHVNQLQIGWVSICRNVSTDISFLGANILAKGGQHAPDYPLYFSWQCQFTAAVRRILINPCKRNLVYLNLVWVGYMERYEQ